MDHQLSQARQRAVAAISVQQNQIVEQANKAVRELGESLADLAATYATAAGLDGGWTFANDEQGAVVLRKVERGPADAALPTPST